MRPVILSILTALFCVTSLACSVGIRDNVNVISRPRYYSIQSGDTLENISRRAGVSYERIAMLNGIRNPNDIAVGDRIVLGYSSDLYTSKQAANARASLSSYPITPASLNKPSQQNEAIKPSENDKTQENKLIAWPVKKGKVVSRFGPRSGSFHDGIDISAPIGTPIYAANSGQVIYSGNNLTGYGNLIIIRGTNGITTVYAHNRRNLVTEKQFVQRGNKIAEVGSTGRSSGPHIHFEVRTKDKKGRYIAVDPIPLLSSTSNEKPRYRVNERLSPILAKVFKSS